MVLRASGAYKNCKPCARGRMIIGYKYMYCFQNENNGLQDINGGHEKEEQ